MNPDRFVSAAASRSSRFLRPRPSRAGLVGILMLAAGVGAATAAAAELARVGVFEVAELDFHGPLQGPTETPARDLDFRVRFVRADESQACTVHGFWDGDGRGGFVGNVFKVRFCPPAPGRWTLAEVASNDPALDGQHRGDFVTATASDRPGFWFPDEASPGRRWYRRSDGSHPYILGNTHYTFLSSMRDGGRPSGNDIAADIRANARFFKKLRFSLFGGRYVHPTEKPFFDDHGQPTDDGNFSHRPNPRWFHQRADLAVRTAAAVDLIADLILCGPDTVASRSTLRAGANGGDARPWLRYVAARYGSYPNVWFCLCNEFDIKQPRYTPARIASLGAELRALLPHPTPISVHTVPRTLWPAAFDELPSWNDHQIIQKKLRHLAPSADAIQRVWSNPGGEPRRKPTLNDELSYQGAGDRHTEQDTLEAHLGALLGGGYGTTGFKPGSKRGHYFWGRFDPGEHTAADNLGWLRDQIDGGISFWRMAPSVAIFAGLAPDFRGLAWPGHEYLLGTNQARDGLVARLPKGCWRVVRYDIIAKKRVVLAESARGRFRFSAPASRAVLFHFQGVSPCY